ncbi:MAG: hypothetical protein P4L59_17695 [Desulfosporosinus sp.]|nr:hypothetical protein [Desulfosporosinus sp.]
MADFQLIIPRSPDECFKAIKKSIPYYHDMTNPMGTKYTYKFKKDKLSIISKGIAYFPVILKIELIKNNNNETKMVGLFTESILLRVIDGVFTSVLFFTSLVTLVAILMGEVPLDKKPIFTVGITLLLLVISPTLFWYHERARKREKKAIISLISRLFSK